MFDQMSLQQVHLHNRDDSADITKEPHELPHGSGLAVICLVTSDIATVMVLGRGVGVTTRRHRSTYVALSYPNAVMNSVYSYKGIVWSEEISYDDIFQLF